MKRVAGHYAVVGFAIAAALFPAHGALAQASQRGQPQSLFSVADFAKLRWLEGTWHGEATGESPLFVRYHFTSDSTIDLSYHADSATGRESATARVYLSVGRIYYTLGPGRWGATRVDSGGIYFVPQVSAHNTFAWTYESPLAWTSTMRTGMGGREHVTVYHMQKLAR